MPYRYVINTGDGEIDPDGAHIESAASYESIDAASIACLDHAATLPHYQFAFVYDAQTGIRATHTGTPIDPRQPKPLIKDAAWYRINAFLDRD